MPRDRDGNVAMIVMGTDGTIARTNFARLYLMQLGAAAVSATKRIMDITGLDRNCSLEQVEYMDDRIFDEAWRFMMSVHNCVKPDIVTRLNALSEKDKRLHLYECLEGEFRFIRDIGCQTPLPHAVLELEKILPPCYGPVTHQFTQDGVDETTVDPILIAPLPIMLLDKTAEDTLTVATGALSAFGILVKHNQADKYGKPWKDSPPRVLGEAENRMYAANTRDPEMVAEMMDRANNPDVQLEMARQVVSSERPGAIETIVDRTKFDYGNSRPIALASGFFEAYGLRVRYVPEDMNPDD